MRFLPYFIIVLVVLGLAGFYGARFLVKEDPKGIADLIEINKPQSGDFIGSPISVSGRARGTWYFEASFPIKITDEAGKELGQGYATADGEWMTEEFVPFRGQVSFSAGVAKKGYVVFQKDNPSGLPEYDRDFKLPVIFVK